MENIALVVIFSIVALIGVFLLIRELVMWYYKINERIELQKKNNKLLEELIQLIKSKQS